MKRSSCAGSPSRYASLDSPGRKTACIGLPPLSAWIQPSRVFSSVRAHSPTTFVPKAELGTSRTILHTFLSEKKSSPVNCILLKNPFASKKNGSLRQPQNRRQSPAVVATASLPTETGCCLDDDFAVVAHPGGSFTLNTAKCRGLLPVFGRGELHVVGDVGDGIVVRVDFEVGRQTGHVGEALGLFDRPLVERCDAGSERLDERVEVGIRQ